MDIHNALEKLTGRAMYHNVSSRPNIKFKAQSYDGWDGPVRGAWLTVESHVRNIG
jgi:hypothetical protein